MGIFSESRKESADSVYKNVRMHLKKDGKTHVVMINSFSKLLNRFFGCEDKYTIQIDEILSLMQDDGYEIVDIKFNSLKNQGITGGMEGFHTLIIYK